MLRLKLFEIYFLASGDNGSCIDGITYISSITYKIQNLKKCNPVFSLVEIYAVLCSNSFRVGGRKIDAFNKKNGNIFAGWEIVYCLLPSSENFFTCENKYLWLWKLLYPNYFTQNYFPSLAETIMSSLKKRVIWPLADKQFITIRDWLSVVENNLSTCRNTRFCK